ncbi:hypothetical protein BD779DRAFT_1679784 [Infundibulicybe gibba]|nr:hypothetical protein BD779DRAFT_1679784 [Infundibulicybe gibba]
MEVAPQLTEIWLKNITDISAIMLPWDQLRDCTLSDSMGMLYVLEHAKNIRTCHLDMSMPPWGRMPEILPYLRCHSLNALIIYWRPEDNRINEFFSSLTLLSLQNLEIRFLPRLGYHWYINLNYLSELRPTLFKFFERSSSHLIALTLSELPISTNQLVRYLVFMLSLISLDIEYTCGNRPDEDHAIDNEFLQYLTFDDTNHLLPHLCALSLRGRALFCEENLGSLIMSQHDINPQGMGVSLLAKLILDCSAPLNWHCREPPLFHRFV